MVLASSNPTGAFNTAQFIVSATAGQGNYTTIAAALAAASSGQTIFIRSGTYTENLTLVAGVDLVAYVTDSDVPNVIINGKCTFTGAGTVGISGIQLETNSDFALAVTGSAASIVYLNDCYINALNNTAISFTSSSASALINITNCTGNLATTGIGLFTCSSAGTLQIRFSQFTNTGGSSTASTTSATVVNIYSTIITFPLSTSSTGTMGIAYSNINTIAQNTAALTLAGTGTSSSIFSGFSSGSASAISIGTGTLLTVSDTTTINSTNTNAITGAGSLNFNQLLYSGTSSLNNVTTQTPLKGLGSGWSWIQTQTASASATLNFTTLPVYPVYALVVRNLVPASNTQPLQMQISTNNGSTYTNSSYTAGINFNGYNSNTFTNFNATTYAPITSNSNSGSNVDALIYVYTSGRYTVTSSYNSTDVGGNSNASGGGGLGASGINAFQFLFGSGNITSGTISIFGLNI